MIGPATVIDLPAGLIDALGYGELLTVAELLGTDLEGWRDMLAHGDAATRVRVLLALALVWAQRADPGLTWAEAQRWRVALPDGGLAGPGTDPTPAAGPLT